MSSFLPIYIEGQDSVSSPRLDTVPTSSLGADSAARSQSSSFEESIASQSSTHQPTPSKVIRYSQQGSSLGTATPSTSLSNPSSQECPSNERQDTRHIPLSLPDEGEVNLRLRPASQEGHRQQLYGTDTRVLEAARNVLNKRMANGEVKINDPSLPTSPVDADRHSHSRDSSVTLKSNQISKVSDQLRTRLSYAMVKVQNGWQSRTIDELESLSQQGSPLSALSEPRHPYEFPGFMINNSQREQSELNSPTEHAALTSKSTNRAPNICSGATNLDRSSPQTMNADSEPRNFHSGHTYESFWREHSISNNSRSIQVQDDQLREPSLAPPVDIQPRNRRRPHSLEVQPHLVTTKPKLPREPSADSATSNITISPITPCQSRSSMRTASQNAAMEKDAVETLLFMSSPGNSGHHPATRSLGTPLRGSFAQPASRIGFTESMVGEDFPDRDFTTTKPFRNPKSLFKPMGVVTSADVDRLLDEMPDGDSSSEDEDGRSAPQRARMYLRP